MTTITFGVGYVGFAYEQLDNSRHAWISGAYQLRTDVANWRNVLSNEWDKQSKWADRRKLRWFWSPDGTSINRVYTDTREQAMNLVSSTWYREPPIHHAPENNGYVIVNGDLDTGIEEVVGPFTTSADATTYAQRADTLGADAWIVREVTGPLVQYMDK